MLMGDCLVSSTCGVISPSWSPNGQWQLVVPSVRVRVYACEKAPIHQKLTFPFSFYV